MNKIKYKKVVSLILSFFIVIVNIASSFAEVITSEGLIKDVYGWDKVNKYSYMSSIKRDSKGNLVYCMNAEKPSPNNEDLPFGGYLDDVAYRILKNGYPNKSFTGNEEKDYVITQLALWAYVDSKEVNIENLIVLEGTKENTQLTKYVKDLYNKSINGSDTQDIKVEFSKKNMEATLEGDYYVTPYFKVNVTGESASSGSFRMDMKTAVNGVKYQLKNGSYVNEIPMNTDFRVAIPKTANEGNVSIRAIGQVTGKKVSWYKAPNDKFQNVAILEDKTVSQQTIDYANITWNAKGEVEITKKSENGDVLQGAGFKLVKDGKDATSEKETDSNGKVVFSDLEPGTYEVVETKAPTGHVICVTNQTVTVTAGQTSKVEVSNNLIKGKIKVLKVDEETGEALQGAEFELKNKATGDVVEKLVTGEDGTATSGLHPFGEYIIQEVKAPNKYVLNGKEYFATISENMKTIEVTAKNKIIKGKIEVNKSDSEIEGLALEGVEFTIYDENTNEVDKLVTDQNGYAISKELNYGKYTMKETKTLENYILSEEVYEVEITENGKVYTYDIKNTIKKGNVEVTKVDSEKLFKMPLKDAEFTIYDEDGNEVDKLVTNIFGKAKSKDLVYGKYTMKETKPPKGYKPSETVYEINISQDGQVVTFDIENNVKKGKVEIIKKDSKTNRSLKGAEFTIFDEEQKEVEKLVTDENGYASVELRYGQYTMKETKAPKGYKLSDTIYEINIDEDGKLVTFDILNDVIEGDVEFSKIDVSTGEIVEGAKIEITGLDETNNHIKIEFESSKDDKFKLPVGEYEFKETIAPDGYVLNEEVGRFEIKENGEVVKAELKNKRIEGILEFEKTDVSTGEVIEGAHIKIECIEGFNKGEVIEFVSSKDGNKFELQYGKYRITETIAPKGYIKTDEVGEFEIKEDGQIVKAELKNQKMIINTENPKTGDRGILVTATIAVGALLGIIGLTIYNRSKYEYYWEYEDEDDEE